MHRNNNFIIFVLLIVAITVVVSATLYVWVKHKAEMEENDEEAWIDTIGNSYLPDLIKNDIIVEVERKEGNGSTSYIIYYNCTKEMWLEYASLNSDFVHHIPREIDGIDVVYRAIALEEMRG